MKYLIRLLAIFAFSVPGFAEADKDVSFLVVGKTPLYQQAEDGTLTHTRHYLFGEIFLKNGGGVKSGTLFMPDGSSPKALEFSDAGHVWKVKRQDFESEAALDAAYPDGTYRFEFETVSGAKYSETVNLKSAEAVREFTNPVHIYFYQQGKLVPQNALDPNHDVLVRWSPFSRGKQDPKGIADDLIFAISSDCNGNSFARSQLPFDPIPALTYADNSFRIPADRLKAGSWYNIIIEHAELVDTGVGAGGIYKLATYPTVTGTRFTTTGDANPACPAP